MYSHFSLLGTLLLLLSLVPTTLISFSVFTSNLTSGTCLLCLFCFQNISFPCARFLTLNQITSIPWAFSITSLSTHLPLYHPFLTSLVFNFTTVSSFHFPTHHPSTWNRILFSFHFLRFLLLVSSYCCFHLLLPFISYSPSITTALYACHHARSHSSSPSILLPSFLLWLTNTLVPSFPSLISSLSFNPSTSLSSLQFAFLI